MIDQAQLAESLARLDAGTRALLDLSLRRAIPDDQVAKVLGVDAASIPPRRARGIAELADMMEVPGPAELAALLIAIPDLPEEAWGVPAPEPFVGSVSRVRRAKAFRRVAVAASPLVALGAVIAAVLVSSSADHSGGGLGSVGAQRTASGTHPGAGAPAGTAAATPRDARHGLPPGVQLTLGHPRAAQRTRHATAHHRHARHAPAATEPAILARRPAQAEAPSQPVAFQPAPVEHSEPPHVTPHHRHTENPAKPQVPTTPPAPVQTPPQPVSTPAPSAPSTPPVQINAPDTDSSPSPAKPYKTQPPQVDLNGQDQQGEDDDEDDDGGCAHSDGYSGSNQGHDSHDRDGDADEQGQGGKKFTPPGLFRRRH